MACQAPGRHQARLAALICTVNFLYIDESNIFILFKLHFDAPVFHENTSFQKYVTFGCFASIKKRNRVLLRPLHIVEVGTIFLPYYFATSNMPRFPCLDQLTADSPTTMLICFCSLRCVSRVSCFDIEEAMDLLNKK